MLETIFATTTDTAISISNLLLSLLTSIALGLAISFVYAKTNRGKIPSQNFTLTLIMLPAVITVIILLVGSNIARAFSLAGAFSIIRFRSAPGDSKDITYVLFSMAIGLACGMGYLLYAGIVAVILCGVMALLEICGFGKRKENAKTLKITIPENLEYQNVFDGVMEQFTSSHLLTKVKTTELGSLFELVYEITMKKTGNEKELIDELRCLNGNLNISLLTRMPSTEI
jgi:hypothetical protein